MRVGEQDLVVLSFDAASETHADASIRLTRAEDAVARLAIGGLSNRAIADRRGTTLATVAKQLESVYRKIGVNSRAELLLKYLPSEPAAGPRPSVPNP